MWPRKPEALLSATDTFLGSAFAFLADISMLVLGGELKRREKALGATG
jgi:hypothetical protein